MPDFTFDRPWHDLVQFWTLKRFPFRSSWAHHVDKMRGLTKIIGGVFQNYTDVSRTQNWDSIRLEEMNEEFFEFLHLEQLAVSSKHLQLSLIESFLVLLLAQLKNSKFCTLIGWPIKLLNSYQSLYLLIWLLSLLLLQFVLSSGHNYTYAFYILPS